ncbi:hypothetical protein A3709_18895 [Halioglobus sp. HI00S01]|uniref:hypothetical protein n=1 Tax=Halioglobus sp. HI00S01 TaxID=1822214 RepID=UPI0007C24DB5|nr:hypothetical protein [Halioglobus sp. HI00S01]KZX57692.1 hypothetical protein A3709_18895 [Halioglobus sp. HI00S01]
MGKQVEEKDELDGELYANELCDSHPQLEFVGTGGGCSALVARLANGGWVVLTSDCVAPEHPNQDDCTALVAYPYDSEGWGADGECGEEVMINKPAKDMVARMLEMDLCANYDRVYHCFWGDAYSELSIHDSGKRDYHFFNDGNGFSVADIAAIRSLEPLGTHLAGMDGMPGEQVRVVRAK